jgi:hypothetical protein
MLMKLSLRKPERKTVMALCILFSFFVVLMSALVCCDAEAEIVAVSGAPLPPATGTLDQVPLVVDWAPPATGTLDPAPRVVDWVTPATLSYQECIGAEPNGLCGQHSVHHEKHVTFSTFDKRKVVPTAKVRFGPFHLSKRSRDYSEEGVVGSGSAVEYRVSVWARSPAVYGPSGYLGAHPGFTMLAEASATLAAKYEEKKLYVTAMLPSVFSAIQIRVTVGGVGPLKSESFPAECRDLPTSAANPEQLDAGCMQAAINPLAVLEQRYVPLAILYEPPGNCSWSNLTQKHTVGAAIGMRSSTATSSQTISDRGFFWNVEHSDFTAETEHAKSSSVQVRVTKFDSIGTTIGLPFNSPGDTRCNQPGAVIPERPDGGPGKGDVFVLLRNAHSLYWDTANMRGSFFFPPQRGTQSRMISLTAYQIQNNTGLPDGVPFFTEEEKAVILSLDPFVGGIPAHLSEDRFVDLDTVIELGQGLPFEHSLDNQQTVEGGQTLTQATKSKTASSESDPAVDLTMQALAYGGGVAASAGANKALADFPGGGFAELAGTVEISGLPPLFTNQSTTNVTTTYSKSSLLSRVSDNAVTQQFFLKDTTKGLSVALYYDMLFGTYVFKPHPLGAGAVKDRALKQLPIIVGSTGLEQLGSVRIEPAPRRAFHPARGSSNPRSLYIARDATGRAVAQVWR